MIIKEFENFKLIEDKTNPFCNLYELEDGSRFYIEPVFYTQLQGLKEQFKEKYSLVIEAIIKTAKEKKRVIFTGNFEFPLTLNNEYLILEISDILDKLKIFPEDKSRGSDYGD